MHHQILSHVLLLSCYDVNIRVWEWPCHYINCLFSIPGDACGAMRGRVKQLAHTNRFPDSAPSPPSAAKLRELRVIWFHLYPVFLCVWNVLWNCQIKQRNSEQTLTRHRATTHLTLAGRDAGVFYSFEKSTRRTRASGDEVRKSVKRSH